MNGRIHGMFMHFCLFHRVSLMVLYIDWCTAAAVKGIWTVLRPAVDTYSQGFM